MLARLPRPMFLACEILVSTVFGEGRVRKWSKLSISLSVSLWVTAYALAQTDSSPHKIQMVTVEPGVQLEVLDWGGSGTPLIFLAGVGDTAHRFDNFAPQFTKQHRVYSITRRGSGASSQPTPANGNYSADHLGDDVLTVMKALHIERACVGRAFHRRPGTEFNRQPLSTQGFRTRLSRCGNGLRFL